MKAVSDRVVAAAEAVWIAAGWERVPAGWRRAGELFPPAHEPGSLPVLRQSDMAKPEVRHALKEYGRAFLPEESTRPSQEESEHPCAALRKHIEARAEALEQRIVAVATLVASAIAMQAHHGLFATAHKEMIEESRSKLRGEIASLVDAIVHGEIGMEESEADES